MPDRQMLRFVMPGRQVLRPGTVVVGVSVRGTVVGVGVVCVGVVAAGTVVDFWLLV